MKKLLLIFLCLPFIGFGQVTDLTNIKKERKKTPVAYDTSYFQVSYSTTEEMKMGLIGQEITVIETNYLYVLDTESKKNISYSDEDKIEGKVFTIEDYIVDGYKEYYLINNGTHKFLFEDSFANKFNINSFLITFKKKYVSKQYYPFKSEVNMKGVDDAQFTIKGGDLITVTDIQYAKLSIVDYAMVFFFDNGLMCKFNIEGYAQPKDEGWVNLTNGYSGELFVEKDVFNEFSKSNATIIDDLRNGKIKTGMTEKQCRLSWGMPTTSYTNIAGYDIVLQYGEIGNSQNLYFKKDKLELIK